MVYHYIWLLSLSSWGSICYINIKQDIHKIVKQIS